MPDIPEEAIAAGAERLAHRDFPDKTFAGYSRAVLEAAAPIIAAEERASAIVEIHTIVAEVRRGIAERIAAALLAVDPVEWALAGQRAGQDAAAIARKIGE
ncbi:hypothetical protein ACIBEJ_34850 [Nonomuraea sp. NPDC050790]|uniref:hypothetical protein n=1 Tax=Nonomuraea sp. NPDC050790 TaxID=3364371 RepID=UPI0037A8F370